MTARETRSGCETRLRLGGRRRRRCALSDGTPPSTTPCSRASSSSRARPGTRPVSPSRTRAGPAAVLAKRHQVVWCARPTEHSIWPLCAGLCLRSCADTAPERDYNLTQTCVRLSATPIGPHVMGCMPNVKARSYAAVNCTANGGRGSITIRGRAWSYMCCDTPRCNAPELSAPPASASGTCASNGGLTAALNAAWSFANRAGGTPFVDPDRPPPAPPYQCGAGSTLPNTTAVWNFSAALAGTPAAAPGPRERLPRPEACAGAAEGAAGGGDTCVALEASAARCAAARARARVRRSARPTRAPQCGSPPVASGPARRSDVLRFARRRARRCLRRCLRWRLLGAATPRSSPSWASHAPPAPSAAPSPRPRSTKCAPPPPSFDLCDRLWVRVLMWIGISEECDLAHTSHIPLRISCGVGFSSSCEHGMGWESAAKLTAARAGCGALRAARPGPRGPRRPPPRRRAPARPGPRPHGPGAPPPPR